MDGFIKLYRKLMKSPIWNNEKSLKVWIWCLLKASHEDREQLIGNQIVHLKRGQFIFGRETASEELKMKESTVYRYMKILEKLQIVSIKSNNKFSVVTIEKWEQYQTEKTKDNNKWTTNEQQMDTNKNVKNNINNISSSDDELHNHFEKIWEVYPIKKGKQKAETYFFAWIKGRKINGRTLKLSDVDMWHSVQAYLMEIKEKKIEEKYISHGDTFFNSKVYDYYEIWRDRYEQSK